MEPKNYTFRRWLDTPCSSSENMTGCLGFIKQCSVCLNIFYVWSVARGVSIFRLKKLVSWLGLIRNHALNSFFSSITGNLKPLGKTVIPNKCSPVIFLVLEFGTLPFWKLTYIFPKIDAWKMKCPLKMVRFSGDMLVFRGVTHLS